MYFIKTREIVDNSKRDFSGDKFKFGDTSSAELRSTNFF